MFFLLQEVFHGFTDEDAEIAEQKAIHWRKAIKGAFGNVLKLDKVRTEMKVINFFAFIYFLFLQPPSSLKEALDSPLASSGLSRTQRPETKDANDQHPKVLLRPSKLGDVESANLEGPFSRGLGKRQIKPSFKMKESPLFSPTKPKETKETAKTRKESDETPKKIIRESKLVLNEKLLERLRKPAQQVEFYQAIQRSMQSADKTPPKLVQGSSMINPGTLSNDYISMQKTDFYFNFFKAGTALVEQESQEVQSKNNRMPGNIVCGICGAVRFYAFILQAKKFGTFSCEPCRKFISKTIKKCQVDNDDDDDELFPCLTGTGQCVVPPGRLLKATNVPPRCQACWLKLCLLGYKLEPSLYDKLRVKLPIIFHDLLPDSSAQNAQDLAPNRGEILQCKSAVQKLSRPLFEGFATNYTEANGKSPVKKLENETKNNVVVERLPNGWTKKAVKRLSGVAKGKWDTYLMTPDQKQLRSAQELKLYIAKSGAVIDSNLVNFSLPKRTAKVDRKLNAVLVQQNSVERKVSVAKTEEKVEVDVESLTNNKTPNSGVKKRSYSRNVIVLPKSSRRQVKVPLKYRQPEEDDEQTSSKKLQQPVSTSVSNSLSCAQKTLLL